MQLLFCPGQESINLLHQHFWQPIFQFLRVIPFREILGDLYVQFLYATVRTGPHSTLLLYVDYTVIRKKHGHFLLSVVRLL